MESVPEKASKQSATIETETMRAIAESVKRIADALEKIVAIAEQEEASWNR